MPVSDLKILSLEDNIADADLIKGKLLSEGYDNLLFELVFTEKEFVDRLTKNTYSLILSDYNLPGFNGLEALLIAKKMCPEIPFIFVSGTVGEETAIELMKKGASDYVLKENLSKLPIAIDRSLREIKEQKALRDAEQELRKLSQAVYQSPVSIVITDINGNIEYVNPKTISLTGYSEEELIGSNTRIFNSGENSKNIYKSLWDTITSGKVWVGEFLNKKKNGEHYWDLASISPILDNKRKIIHYLAINEDITKQKKLTFQLVEAKEKAEESDRLKTAFLTNISHEIRTPMNGIMGFTDLLKTPGLTGEQQQEFIDVIKESGNRMLNIINDIIDISKIEAGHAEIRIEKSNINQILKDLHAFFKPESEGFELLYKIDLSDEDCYIETDMVKLSQVLTNLIKNALKFTDDGHVHFGYKCKEGALEFFVEDTGIGISTEDTSKIFERFIQADMSHTRNYEGAGLGLSISKAYIEMLGGKIWVESKLGEGSTFYFTIPNKQVKKEQAKKRPDAQEVQFRNQLNILIVDDSPSVRFFFKELLKINNVTLFFAKNGKEAVEIVRKQDKIDLILMDLKMPVMDGFEATRQIKQMKGKLPIIVQTAYASQEDEIQARESGCDDFITKPIKYELLFPLINKYTEN